MGWDRAEKQERLRRKSTRLPWSKAEERKKHSAPERSAKPAKLEDSGPRITWLSVPGAAPLRPSKQKGEDRGSPELVSSGLPL